MEKILPRSSERNSSPVHDHLPPEVKAILQRFSTHLAEHLTALIHEQLSRHAVGEPLLDIKDVARRLNTSVRTVEALVADRQLVPIRIRGLRRFSPQAVDDFIRSCARRTRGGRAAR